MEKRSAIVAILGKPNVGKSTLLNRVVGSHISSVSPKPQTTIRRIRGIFHDQRGQLIFVDTPGLHQGSRLWDRALQAACECAARDADLRLRVVDLTLFSHYGSSNEALGYDPFEITPSLVALNKKDLVKEEEVKRACALFEERGIPTVAISAATGEGLDLLLDCLFSLAPPGPPLYPEDLYTDLTLREIVEELIRESLYTHLKEELPYTTFVEIEEFKEEKDPVVIRAVIHVNKPSQKAMVIGEGGKMIRSIGIRARKMCEGFLGKRVYLDLWVKVTPGWNKCHPWVYRITRTHPYELKGVSPLPENKQYESGGESSRKP